MPDRKSIGSEGLQQGGPDLGNDYSRDLHSDRKDALTTPNTIGLNEKAGENENVNQDQDIDETLEDDVDLGEDDLDDDDDLFEEDDEDDDEKQEKDII